MIKAIVAALVVGFVSNLQADPATHQKAAEQMLSLMDMEMVLKKSVDEMLKAQIQANPAIAPFEGVMKQFFAKHMSWNTLKPDLVKIYMEEFTEQELNELNKFYQTPTGKKAVQSMPTLMSKGSAIGSQKIQQHMPELQAAIAAEAQKQGPGAGAPEKKK